MRATALAGVRYLLNKALVMQSVWWPRSRHDIVVKALHLSMNLKYNITSEW